MANKLQNKHLRALRWALAEASGWRGLYTGLPDHGVLEAFDARIALAKEALKIVVRNHKEQQNECKKQKGTPITCVGH